MYTIEDRAIYCKVTNIEPDKIHLKIWLKEDKIVNFQCFPQEIKIETLDTIPSDPTIISLISNIDYEGYFSTPTPSNLNTTILYGVSELNNSNIKLKYIAILK